MRALLTCCTLVAVSSSLWAQMGISYRFRADTLEGTVWVLGDNARREIESGEGGTAAGRIEIWKNGGTQILILNPRDRTYYEAHAYAARMGASHVPAGSLTANPPFQVQEVRNIKAELKRLLREESTSGYTCEEAVLTFSYDLKLGLQRTDVVVPGRVEGSAHFCLAEAPGAVRMPFHHDVAVVSGLASVDKELARHLSGVTGIPVARMVKATRRIENGEPVSSTSVLLLSDVQVVPIAAERFEVPEGYRFQEPELVAPVRKKS